jgi:undecaprenyl-diphosphatase
MNLTIGQTIFLALLQGVTELFPISSLGHTVILPGLLGFPSIEINTGCGGQSCFLPLVTALHLGTSIALIVFFWRDWLQLILTLIKNLKEGEVRTGTEDWVSWLIIIGVIPTGLIGLILQEPLKRLFASPVLAAAFLVMNGSILFAVERWRQYREARMAYASAKEREASYRPLSSLNWKEAVIVGLAFGHEHGGRPGCAAQPRGLGALLLLAGYPGYLRCGRAGDPTVDRAVSIHLGTRYPRRSAGRRRGFPQHQISHEIL